MIDPSAAVPSAPASWQLSDALLGAIIGGSIGIAGSVITAVFQHRQWKRERLLEHLRRQRVELSEFFASVIKKTEEGMKDGLLSADALTDVYLLCPAKVRVAIVNMMRETDRTPERLKDHSLEIQIAMKESLRDLDRRMDRILGLRRFRNARRRSAPAAPRGSPPPDSDQPRR